MLCAGAAKARRRPRLTPALEFAARALRGISHAAALTVLSLLRGGRHTLTVGARALGCLIAYTAEPIRDCVPACGGSPRGLPQYPTRNGGPGCAAVHPGAVTDCSWCLGVRADDYRSGRASPLGEHKKVAECGVSRLLGEAILVVWAILVDPQRYTCYPPVAAWCHTLPPGRRRVPGAAGRTAKGRRSTRSLLQLPTYTGPGAVGKSPSFYRRGAP